MIPPVDVRRKAARLFVAFRSAAARVVASEHLVGGGETESLEEELAVWSGYRHVRTASSGGAALHLALRGLRVGQGDEVVLPAYGPVALPAAVVATGATPVFADVEPETAQLDPMSAARACGNRTMAVVVHHTFGRPATVPELGVPVVEDATHAAGAVRHHPGSAAIVYSLHPSAPLSSFGDAGMVVTDDDGLADRVTRLRGGGRNDASAAVESSLDFRLSELEAAWLRVSLRVLGPDTARRRAIVQRYRDAAPALAWQADHTQHAHALPAFRSRDRSRVTADLARRGIGTFTGWPLALTEQPAYREATDGRCPVAEAWAAECVVVPGYADLLDDEVGLVARALSETYL